MITLQTHQYTQISFLRDSKVTTEAPKPWKESILHGRGLGLARLKDSLFQETPKPCHLFLAMDFPL